MSDLHSPISVKAVNNAFEGPPDMVVRAHARAGRRAGARPDRRRSGIPERGHRA